MNKVMKILKHPKKAIRRVLSTICNVYKFKRAGVAYESLPYFDGMLYISASRKHSIRIGKNAAFNSGRKCNPVGFENKMMLSVAKEGFISIGNSVGMSNTVIYSVCGVVIEDNVLLGNGVKIYDTDFHSLNAEDRMKRRQEPNIACKPVYIRKGAFIGAGSLILKGVTIGEGSIVGAASVVTKNIPDGEIWAGNPAKFIRKI